MAQTVQKINFSAVYISIYTHARRTRSKIIGHLDLRKLHMNFFPFRELLKNALECKSGPLGLITLLRKLAVILCGTEKHSQVVSNYQFKCRKIRYPRSSRRYNRIKALMRKSGQYRILKRFGSVEKGTLID